MKKYTSKILTCGLIILVLIYIGYFYAIFHELKNGQIYDNDIMDPAQTMKITSSTDEDGKMQITAERTENGETKTITIDPNTGTVHEKVITTKTTTTTIPADTAKQ